MRTGDNLKQKHNRGTQHCRTEGKFSHYQGQCVILHIRTPRPRDMISIVAVEQPDERESDDKRRFLRKQITDEGRPHILPPARPLQWLNRQHHSLVWPHTLPAPPEDSAAHPDWVCPLPLKPSLSRASPPSRSSLWQHVHQGLPPEEETPVNAHRQSSLGTACTVIDSTVTTALRSEYH